MRMENSGSLGTTDRATELQPFWCVQTEVRQHRGPTPDCHLYIISSALMTGTNFQQELQPSSHLRQNQDIGYAG